MNTKLLKQKILDLAIRGKLTQQLKSDGTAADLLKQISEQKRESSSTLSSPRRRGSPSAQSEKTIIPLDKSEAPFEIPANWEWVRLGDVAYIASGSTPSKDCFVESGVPYLKMYNLRNQQIDFEYKPQYVKREVHEGKLARSKAKPGDVIMNIVGPPLGKVALVPESLPECNFNQAAVLIRAHFCTNLMNQYIRYFLLQMDEINAINTKGTAGQENISLTQTQNMRLPLPPLAEQQRIVAKIEEAFAEIEAIEKNKELLKTHIKQTRQKILDLAIHGKLVPQNKSDEPASVLLERITRDNPHYEKLIDIPFEIPDSWEWVKLGDVCSFFGGGTPDKSNPKYWNGSINWASVKDIKGIELTDTVDKITEAGFEESASSYAEKEDLILVTRINPGMCIQTKIKTAINQDLKVVKVPSQINKVYVMVFCNYAQKWFLEKSSGTTVKGIKIDAVLQMPFPLPPLAEQKRIVDRIEEIFKSLDEISLHLA